MATIKGNPITYNSPNALNLAKLTVSFMPDPYYYATRQTEIKVWQYVENIAPITRTSSQSTNGISFNLLSNYANGNIYGVEVWGQRESSNVFFNLNYVDSTTLSIAPGTYKAYGYTENVSFRVYIINAQSQEQLVFNSKNTTTFTVPSDAIASWVRLQVETEDYIDERIYPLFTQSTETVNEYTISFPDNEYIFGGTLDVTSGILTVTHKGIDIGTLDYTLVNKTDYHYFDSSAISDAKVTTNDYEATPYYILPDTSFFPAIDIENGKSNDGFAISAYNNNGSAGLRFRFDSMSTVAELKERISGAYLAYELATPVTIQCTGVSISPFEGTNTIMTYTYGLNTLTYIEQVSQQISKVISKSSASASPVTWLDVTQDTVMPEYLLKGYTATKANGVKITGTLDPFYEMAGRKRTNNEWVRPEGYPDLDILYDTISDTESCIYLTYDLTKTPGYGWIGIYAAGSSYYVERGHISNNAFVADYTSSAISSGNRFQQALDSTNGNVQLWRVRSSGDLSQIRFCPNTDTTANNYNNNLQPCVERVGKIPYCTLLSGSPSTTYSTYSFGTVWLERDKIFINPQTNVTSISGMYNQCYSLVETNCGDWDTTNWTVGSISSAFSNCISLPKLDLSKWNTTYWTVTGMASCWSNCYSLKELNVSSFITYKWHPATMEYVFYRCIALEKLDLSNWDVSGWTITSLRAAWNDCYSLEELNISNWNTSNWQITNLNNTWTNCLSLLKLDISNWNTSNWAVTTLAGTWQGCYNLQELNLNSWNVSNWAVTSMNSTWYQCRQLKNLYINSWNVSNWVVTTLENTWNQCHSLRSLNLNDWDVSNWRITTLSAAWSYCSTLKELKIDQWDVSDWVVTTFSNVFSNTFGLQELDLTSWNVSNWSVTTIYNAFNSMQSLKILDIHNWDVSNWALTDARYLYSGTNAETMLFPEHLHGTVANSKYTANMNFLVNFNGIAIDIDQNYSNSIRLTRESLLTIISRLPTVSSTKTLTIGQINKLKLTSSEIAVATQKGWTIA